MTSFVKVKAIKSEQTMDGGILVLEERQAYNEAHQSHAYLLNMKQREHKKRQRTSRLTVSDF